jgi:hypothetical protein
MNTAIEESSRVAANPPLEGAFVGGVGILTGGLLLLFSMPPFVAVLAAGASAGWFAKKLAENRKD